VAGEQALFPANVADFSISQRPNRQRNDGENTSLILSAHGSPLIAVQCEQWIIGAVHQETANAAGTHLGEGDFPGDAGSTVSYAKHRTHFFRPMPRAGTQVSGLFAAFYYKVADQA
jgi:hypothetical protein